MFPEPRPPDQPRLPAELLAAAPEYPTVPAGSLQPHPHALRMPAQSEDEFAALVEDIRENGVDVPVLVDEDGRILDGIHRWRVCGKLDIPVPIRVKAGLTEPQKLTRALSWNLRRRHLTTDQKKEIAKGLRADGHSYQRIEEVTGWPHSTVHDWLKPRSEPSLGDRCARPGEAPERGCARYLEIVQQTRDPDVDEDTRSWARADGATAMMTLDDFRIATDSRHAAAKVAAMERFQEFAEDIGETPRSLSSYWITAIEWPREDRKARTSYEAHAAVQGNNKALLRSGMDEHEARGAAKEAVAKRLDEVLRLILDNQSLTWASFEFVQQEMGRINAYLQGGWDAFVAFVEANRPEPVCGYCSMPESMEHLRNCIRPRPCKGCEGVGGHTRPDCPTLEREVALAEVRSELGYMARTAPRDRVPHTGDHVAGECPPEDR